MKSLLDYSLPTGAVPGYGNWRIGQNHELAKKKAWIAAGGPALERQRFSNTIGYSSLTGDEKTFADSWLNGQDWNSWNAGWDKNNANEFSQALTTFRNQRSLANARGMYDKLSDINSTYNQDRFNRISRMYSPETNTNSMLANALGLSSKSSAFLADSMKERDTVKGREDAYNAFQQSFEQGQGLAAQYLNMGIQGEQNLLGLLQKQEQFDEQLKYQKESDAADTRNSLINTLLKGGVAVGATMLTGNPMIGATAANAMPSVGGGRTQLTKPKKLAMFDDSGMDYQASNWNDTFDVSNRSYEGYKTYNSGRGLNAPSIMSLYGSRRPMLGGNYSLSFDNTLPWSR